MPLALLALTISAFAIGTTEFVIVGLIPTIAQQLGVSVPSAGLLVSIYAIGVAIGAPVLTALTGRVPRKALLIGLMVLFTLGNLIAWQSPNYNTLVMARLLTGLAHGVFFSIGATIATSLVPKEKAASARVGDCADVWRPDRRTGHRRAARDIYRPAFWLARNFSRSIDDWRDCDYCQRDAGAQ